MTRWPWLVGVCGVGQGAGDHEVPPGLTPETSGGHGAGGGRPKHCVSHSLSSPVGYTVDYVYSPVFRDLGDVSPEIIVMVSWT